MRTRLMLVGAAAIIVVVLIGLSVADGLLVDLFWFTSLGFRAVFTITLLAQIVIFLCVWLITFAAIAVSGLIAVRVSHERDRLRVVRRSDQVTEVNLPELIRSLGDRVPWRLIVVGVAAVLAVFVAQGEAGNWDVYLKAFNGVPFGVTEPAFGRDVGFFVFQLPLWQELRDLFLMILVLTAVVSGAIYWARGEIDFRESPPHISGACAAHGSILLGVLFLQRAMNYWLGRFELTLHSNDVVFGLRYV